jgi:hypothetical protein
MCIGSTVHLISSMGAQPELVATPGISGIGIAMKSKSCSFSNCSS